MASLTQIMVKSGPTMPQGAGMPSSTPWEKPRRFLSSFTMLCRLSANTAISARKCPSSRALKLPAAILSVKSVNARRGVNTRRRFSVVSIKVVNAMAPNPTSNST